MTRKLTKPTVVIKTVKVLAVDGAAAKQLIGYHIREARKARGLTQEECCAMLGVGRGQLANVELGRSFLSAESLVHAIVNLNLRLDAKFFGVTP